MYKRLNVEICSIIRSISVDWIMNLKMIDKGVLDGKQYKRCIAYERYQFKNAYNDHNRVSDAPSSIFSCGRHPLLFLRLDLLDFVLRLLFWHWSVGAQAQSRIDKGAHYRVQT